MEAEKNWRSRAEIRPATESDVQDVLRIFDVARAFMRSYGNYSQWGGAYPGLAELTADVANGEGFVCTVDGVTEAYFMFMRRDEPLYHVIDDGGWLNDKPYAAVHRMASAGNYKGISDFCFDWCKAQAGSDLRGDTHRDNPPMQHVFARNGFVPCGTVYMEDGTPRIAFHYVKK